MAQTHIEARSPAGTLHGEFERMLNPVFKLNDFAITLTFSEDFKPDPRLRAKDVRMFVRQANAGLLGATRYKHGERLKVAYVFELNVAGTAIHLHMVLENPAVSPIPEADKLNFLRDCWMAMRCSRSPNANTFKLVDDVAGWSRYLFKEIRRHSTEMADVENWEL